MVMGKYFNNNPIWFVLLSPFLLCFILLLLNLSVFDPGKDGVTTLVHDFAFPNPSDQKPIRDFLGNQATPNLTARTKSNDHSVQTNQGKINNTTQKGISAEINQFDSCLGRYIYVHDLPSQFNKDLLKNCRSLMKWFDMCEYLSNKGFGKRIEDNNSKRVLMKKGWFSTNQFSLEIIFHNRMNMYKCLTNDSSMASAIYVPFYAGLEVGQHLWDLNISKRDSSARKLVHWLSKKAEWKTMWGRDHFLIGGRIGWDFRRQTEEETDWGSKLMFLPESNNMTLLSIESSSWNNDIAIPYPTYFHPSKESEVLVWQERMRKRKRRYLFSFAGAPRPNSDDSIRDNLIKQCKSSSKHCKFMRCDVSNQCEEPAKVIGLFQNSIFCLQPTGDSYTRRSTFDSILAGCIPVFFHPGSAYVQYLWHLPKNYSKYSVFISQTNIKENRVIISERLLGISKNEVRAMREEVIKLIPRIIYGNWRSDMERKLEDAFDIAVKGLLERVEKVRKKIKEGKDPSEGFAEESSRKFDLLAFEGVVNP
ncbi:hypothetical protein FEM48_Zijuj07G0033100 [Ziziphus jujuba var. spinosa]|uniref:Exostosin GT47 domain-containing protein n=1 Tax=Ziziphus jujuba var. spinosa TaxID=714518 RepID=A0A978V254_ZIZJJ|nr:hypothetical protein FEM48_Zijuj07G0033100 [Ziziphus jujuba var. spinosa]